MIKHFEEKLQEAINEYVLELTDGYTQARFSDDIVELGNGYNMILESIYNNFISKQRIREAIKRVCLQTGAEVTEAQLLIEFGLNEEKKDE
jgi:hypothetical protein